MEYLVRTFNVRSRCSISLSANFAVGMGSILALPVFTSAALLKVGGGKTEGDRKDADEKEKNPGFGRSFGSPVSHCGLWGDGTGKAGKSKGKYGAVQIRKSVV